MKEPLPMMQRATGLKVVPSRYACTDVTAKSYMQAAEDPFNQMTKMRSRKTPMMAGYIASRPQNTRMRNTLAAAVSLLFVPKTASHVRPVGGRVDFSCATRACFAKVGQEEGQGLVLQNGLAVNPVCGCMPRANPKQPSKQDDVWLHRLCLLPCCSVDLLLSQDGPETPGRGKS